MKLTNWVGREDLFHYYLQIHCKSVAAAYSQLALHKAWEMWTKATQSPSADKLNIMLTNKFDLCGIRSEPGQRSASVSGLSAKLSFVLTIWI